jgi:hypothetical protein
MVALLHSPLGNQHPASLPRTTTAATAPSSSSGKGEGDTSRSDQDGNAGNKGEGESKCEFIPHQLRGSVMTFSQISPMVSTETDHSLALHTLSHFLLFSLLLSLSLSQPFSRQSYLLKPMLTSSHLTLSVVIDSSVRVLHCMFLSGCAGLRRRGGRVRAQSM